MRNPGISALLALLLLGTPLSAQVGHTPMRITSFPNFGSGQHTHLPRSLYLGSPFWADYPTSDAPSPIIVVQTPQASPERVPQIEEPKPAPPLLIEWQGDRYVRRTSEPQSNARAIQSDYSETSPSIASRAPESGAHRDLPPATFVFRDGHREQSSDYSIISGVIYTRADYWTSGSWSKQIPLAQLDLPATFRANQDQGVPFRLPNAPNEVITRP
jgi:hypothetical protein